MSDFGFIICLHLNLWLDTVCSNEESNQGRDMFSVPFVMFSLRFVPADQR